MPTKDQAALFQGWPDHGADFPVAVCHSGFDRLPAHMHVRAGLALCWHAVNGANGFAVNQNDALVAIADVGEIFLDDHRLAIELGEQLHQAGQVFITGLDVEHAGAAIAEQRLDDHVLMLSPEVQDCLLIRRDQRWRQARPSKCVTNSFSGAFRTWAGSFTTSVLG